MEDLKIVGWTSFDDIYPTKKWSAEELKFILRLIKQEIFEKKYVFSGEEHQNSFTGVPVFSDGTCFRASMRCWGKIMASIYSGPNGEELSYMYFYMSLKESILPPSLDEVIEPAEVDEESCGCTVPEDRQIVNEAISFGMSFMTTDKVLKKLYENNSK